MRLQKYSILQISARTIMNCAKKTEDGYCFIFGTVEVQSVANSETK